MAVALLALFIALGGTAVATKHYLITSTAQIKPGLLARLKGDEGPKGAPGASGPTGKEGVQGAAGAAGPEGKPGPSGLGPTGSAGPTGGIGPTGHSGPTGRTGATGSTGAAGERGEAGATGAAGASAFVALTRLHYSEGSSTSIVSPKYHPLMTVGTFNKRLANTVVRLTANGTVSPRANLCEIELRIDGLKNNGSSSEEPEPSSGAAATFGQGEQSFTITGDFAGLSPGEHTVSFWVRLIANAEPWYCGVNSLGGRDVFVEEFSEPE